MDTMKPCLKNLAVLAAAVCVTSGTAIAATVTLEAAGSGQSFSTEQPSLVMTAIVNAQGPIGSVGRVEYFAGNYVPSGYYLADGSELQIADNQALFSRIGTTYGGNGTTTFRLPDLRGRTAVGTGNGVSLGQDIGSRAVTLTQANLPAHTHDTATGPSDPSGQAAPAAFENRQPGLGLDFEIFTTGIYPARNLTSGTSTTPNGYTEGGTHAFVTIDAGSDGVERDTANANGQLLQIASNTALFSLVGTTYGGDGRTTFGLPDTGGKIVTGFGNGPGLSNRALGQTQGQAETTMTEMTMPTHAHIDPQTGAATQDAGEGQVISNLQEEITLNYVIALEGTFPARALNAGTGSVTSSYYGVDAYLGQVAMFAGNFAPRGWAFAHGQLLPIAQHQALFAILGTTYGGDGRTSFGLPDLRGRTVVGSGSVAGQTYFVGQTLGTETLSLTTQNLPSHTHTVNRPAPVPLPAAGMLLIAGIGAFGLMRRRRA
jgi:microcystin-dependent protein